MTYRVRKVTAQGKVFVAYGRDAEDAGEQIERSAFATLGFHPIWQSVTVEQVPVGEIRQGRPIYRGGEHYDT